MTLFPPLSDAEKSELDIERTQLAAERTFLSWVRTGLTVIGLGIAIARFIVFKNISNERLGHRIGQLLIFWGVGLLIFALVEYRRAFRELSTNKPHRKIAFYGLSFFSVLLILLCTLLFWIVIE